MTGVRRALLLLVVVTGWASPARGSGDASPDARAVEETRSPDRLAITMSPPLLTCPILELTGELRLARWLGVAVVAGAGGGETFGEGSPVFTELGGQLRTYPLGDFDTGLLIGVELVGKLVTPGSSGMWRYGVAGAGFAGLKYTASWGLTAELHAGVGWLEARSRASSGNVLSRSGSTPMANLNVGWAVSL